MGINQRDSDREGTSPPKPRALGHDRPAVKLDQSLHQRKTDAKPPLRAFQSPVDLCEHFKHIGQHSRRDPQPGVADANHHFAVLSSGREIDDSAFRCVLGGICEQVGNNLGKPRRVGR